MTDGRGVDVIYDSVGRTTFEKGLTVIRPRGMMVLFGQSSGPVAPVDPGLLNTRGSLFLTRPSLGHYLNAPDELRWRVRDLMQLMGSGKVKVNLGYVSAGRGGARASGARRTRHNRQAAPEREERLDQDGSGC